MRQSVQIFLIFLISFVFAQASRAEDWDDAIRPLLQANCSKCHGGAKQKGGLDLRSVASTLRGGESGPAIVPQKPGDSLLIQLVPTWLRPAHAAEETARTGRDRRADDLGRPPRHGRRRPGCAGRSRHPRPNSEHPRWHRPEPGHRPLSTGQVARDWNTARRSRRRCHLRQTRLPRPRRADPDPRRAGFLPGRQRLAQARRVDRPPHRIR